MFSKDVNHVLYFDENHEHFYEFTGFPYFRLNSNFFNDAAVDENEDSEKLLMVMNLRSAQYLMLSNKNLRIFRIPTKDSFFKMAGGKVLGSIPVVSDVLDGLDAAKDLGSGAKHLTGWVSGKNKSEKLERLQKGLPTKKDFKNVEWKLKKPEGKAMVLSYADYILLANGFHWKTLSHVNFEENKNAYLSFDAAGIQINDGHKKKTFRFCKDDYTSFDIINEHTDLIFQSSMANINKTKYQITLHFS